MSTPSTGMSLEELERRLEGWKQYLPDLASGYKEERYYIRHSVGAKLERELKDQCKSQLPRKNKLEKEFSAYDGELDTILGIPSMFHFCEIKTQQIETGSTDELEDKLAEIRRGFEPAAHQAQQKVSLLVSLRHACRTALRLCNAHLQLIQITAWNEGIALPEQAVEDMKEKPSDQDDPPAQSPSPPGPGRKRDPKLEQRAAIVRKYIFFKKDFEDIDKMPQMFSEFDAEDIPAPRDSDGLEIFIGRWRDQLHKPGKMDRLVTILNRDRWPRKKTTTE